MHSSSIRLSIDFFTKVKGFSKDEKGKVVANNGYKASVLKNLNEMIEGGHTEAELSAYINQWAKSNDGASEVYNVEDILRFFGINVNKKEVKIDPNNLIRPGRFYYHPKLQIAPPPPRIKVNVDGTFEASYDNEEFFLEIKQSFTYKDLNRYFLDMMGRHSEEADDRFTGAFKHLLGREELDVIMYSIDASRFVSEDIGRPRPKQPFHIEDYIDYGKELLDERKNTFYMEGLSHVIPRRK